MQAFLSGQEVSVVIALQDGLGNDVTPTEVSYRVLDQDEKELIPSTPVTLEEGAKEFRVTVSGDLNVVNTTIPSGMMGFVPTPKFREMRVIEVYLKTEEGTIKVSREYMVEAEEVLVEAVNSFQNYPTAILTAADIPNLPGWNNANKSDRVSALIRARQNIGHLRFRYVFDAYQNIVDNTLGVADLTLATPSQYRAFPMQFKEALRRAQILEADYLLGGDEYGEIRRSGIMSMTVGEAKQFFRTTKPIEAPVCKRAMQELTKWVLSRHRLTRT